MTSVYVLMVAIAYLIGSISSAILICKALGLADPRTQGSGNPGATNVLRIGGKLPAALVFVADTLKGLLPVILAKGISVPDFWLGMIGFAAFLGHLYPIFFSFQGGKGVATAFGAILGLSWQLGLLLFSIWFIIVLATRYVSLASMLAAATVPLVAFVFGYLGLIVPLILMALLTIWRHRSNIKKLRAGTESKIGKK